MDINSEKIKSLRDEKLWSQDELAIASGLSLRTIQRAEREGVASLQTVKAIAATFNVDINSLRREIPATASDALAASGDPQSVQTALPLRGRAGRLAFGLAFSVLACAGLGWVVWNLKQQHPVAPVVIHVESAKPAPARAVTQAPIDVAPPAIKPAEPTKPPVVAKQTTTNVDKVLKTAGIAKSIRGHWESISTGVVMTVDINDETAEFGGEAKGSSSYTLLKDVISYRFGNQIVAAEVRFDGPNAMTWTTVESGTTFKWTRDKIVPPNHEDLLAQMQGTWRGLGFVHSLEVNAGKAKLVFKDDSKMESAYLIKQQRISINRGGSTQHYVVSFESPSEMTWSRVFGTERYAFVRESVQAD